VTLPNIGEAYDAAEDAMNGSSSPQPAFTTFTLAFG
jgi:hypothetical protein